MYLIKQASADDIPVIESILSEAADWMDSTDKHMWAKTELMWQNLSRFYEPGNFHIAYCNGESSGCMAVTDHDPILWKDISKGDSLFIHKLAVRRKYAGKGAAAALVERAKEFCRMRGIVALRLDTHQMRPKLRAFYERQGFTCVWEGLIFEKYHTAFYAYEIKKPRVLCAMSGGIDSSAAALLLLRDGYDVEGATLRLFDEEDTGIAANAQDIADAAEVCRQLGINHQVIDLRDAFRREVMQPFVQSYLDAETPNPCIFCNRKIKFGAMLEIARELGFEKLATGHYAQVKLDPVSGRYTLTRPADRKKDQTYVLYSLTQDQLGSVIFPLWGYTKEQARSMSSQAGLVNASKPDSQDICFVRDGEYAGFIARFHGDVPSSGDYIDSRGNILGRHKGIVHYTIGQRKGLGVSFNAHKYVLAKSSDDNTVTLGELEDLFRSELYASNVNFIPFDTLSEPMRVTAKTRYAQQEQPAVIYPYDGGIRVVFDQPQKAITSGQAVVLYDGDRVVGGGTIDRAESE